MPLPPVPSLDDIEILEHNVVFKGFFQIDRYKLRHKRFDGSWSQPIVREVFERGHAAAVLLYDPVRDMVGFAQQFRIAARSAGLNPWLTEIVAGIIDPGETAEETAVREAKEEAGVDVTDLATIGRFIGSPGGSSETVKMFCGKIDSSQFAGTHGLVEEGEDIRVFAVPAAEAFAAVEDGRINNSVTVIAVQWLALHREELRKRWAGSKG